MERKYQGKLWEESRGRQTRFPICQLFEVHGSKFKPHPFRDLGQTSIKGIAHTVFFLGIGKDALNGFLAFCVKLLIFWGISGIVGQFLIILPDVAQDGFHAVFGAGA